MKSNEICNDIKSCSGCEACANVCAHDAISMEPDWRGFLYPSIDANKCVDCKLCQKTCPVNKVERKPFVFSEAAVYIDGNKENLYRASSGGAFGTVARYVLSQGGVVFGCSMDDDYLVKFISVDRLEDLQKLHGSKYVQGQVGMIYRQVKETLKSGRLALMCACPCHIAGLKSYLRKDYVNLITMDLICHGVPSQSYFRSYVKDLLSRQAKSGITTFRFRHKEETCCETLHTTSSSKNVYEGFHNKDYYMTYFLWGKGYRDSCYQCRYPGSERVGDFTIGDFWNNERAKLPIDVSKGSSLIFFNTAKARKLKGLFEENSTFVPLKSFTEAMGPDKGQMEHPCRNDLRTKLIYLLFKMFGVRGPNFLFMLDQLRMR